MEIYKNLIYKDNTFEVCTGFEYSDKKPIFHKNTKIIMDSAFENNYCLEVLDLSNTKVEKIGTRAFQGCSNLNHVIFPNTLTEIWSGAFYCCKKLYNIDLSNTNLKFIRREAFVHCAFDEIKLPDTLEVIREYAFSLTPIKNLTLPSSLKYLDLTAFDNTKLENLTLPNNINLLADYVSPGMLGYANLNMFNEIFYTKLSPKDLELLQNIADNFHFNVRKIDLDFLINQGKSFKQINSFYKETER